MNCGGVSVAEHNNGCRKKLKPTITNSYKEGRYVPTDPQLLNWTIPCQHNKKKVYQCRDIDNETLIFAKNYFYKDNSTNAQNVRLASLLKIAKPARDRNRHANTYKPHELQVQYTITRKNKSYVVCRAFFQKLFEVKSRRVLLVAKKVQKGESVAVNSGGDRKSPKQLPKFQKIKSFIGKFKAQESHYNRNKSKRLYLSSLLTIRKMWKMYNNEADTDLKVNYGYFHKIFSTSFNLGFGSPATDVCSYCERMKHQIKSNPDDINSKRDLQVHQVRAKQFNLLMKEQRTNEITFCFDLQQVQNLPKTPIQEAYYSLQLAFYSFCVVDIDSRNPNFYVWTENLSGRGSNEIGSALLHFLRNRHFDQALSKIRLFCDGCGGQNKNSHVLHALMYWLHKESPKHIEEIQIIFPVRGHSYLPADRVFGRVEKELRRHDRIILPSDYVDIYKKFGNVFQLGNDWMVYDLKGLLEVFFKYDGISEQKIVLIKKEQNRNKRLHHVTVNSQVFYRNSDPSKKPKTLIKRGKSLETTLLKECTEKNKISSDKGKSVNNLLKAAFGENWRFNENLKWYFELLCGDLQTPQDTQMVPDEQAEHCNCVHEETELQT